MFSDIDELLNDDNKSRHETKRWFKDTRKVIAIIILLVLIITGGGFYYVQNIMSGKTKSDQNEVMAVEHLPKIGASVAFGDSTMSLADGDKISRKGCIQEKNNWVDRLPDVVNLSCPGNSIYDTFSIIKDSNALKENPRRVLVSIGTNTLRNKGMDADISEYVQLIVDRIRSVDEDVEIVFVGYLSVPYNAKCLKKEDKDAAKLVDEIHHKANSALKKVAKKNGIRFIDMSDLKYNICDPKKTFIRLPNTTKGTNWHTTSVGHDVIAKRIAYLYPDDYKPLKPKR